MFKIIFYADKEDAIPISVIIDAETKEEAWSEVEYLYGESEIKKVDVIDLLG